MALLKFGSLLKIAASGLTVEDVITEKAPSAVTQKEIEKKNADFLYFRARAISAGDQGPVEGQPNPNGNGDYFPRKELEASYHTFANRQLFLNHESDHPIKSIGKILDAYEVEDPETGEYYIECLAKIDRKLHPEMARKVETGELNTVSMGCSCEASMCSVCGTTIHTDNDEKCAHLDAGGILKEYTAEVDMPQYGIKRGNRIKAFSINSGLCFNELSIVNVPADPLAFIKTIIASNLKNKISKKASLDDTEKSHLQALLDTLDEATRTAIKAEFCACEMPKEEPKMSDKEVKPEVSASSQGSVDTILEKLNAMEYMRLATWMENKMVKAATVETAKVEAPAVVEPSKLAEAKVEEEKKTAVEAAIDNVKNSFLGKLFSNAVKKEIEKGANPAPVSKELRAEFTKAATPAESFWTLYRGDKKILRATLKTIFEETLADADIEKMATSEEYGKKLVETYKELGFVKTAKLLGVAFKVKEVSNSKVEMPAKGDFVKAGTETKADKEADKSNEAIDKKDQTEVGTHLDSSKPEGDKEASKKIAEIPGEEVKEVSVTETTPEEVKPTGDAPVVEDATPKMPETPEEHKSAFDKIDDKLVIADGIEARKDKETNEIVISDSMGQEVKRLPDGFGDDVPTVLKLLQAIVGADHKEEGVPVSPEAPKMEEPMPETPADAPVAEEPKAEEPAMAASKKDSITKEAEELQKKADELAKKEAELKKYEAKIHAEKFASALNARTERCKKIVEAMVEKDLLPMDEVVLNAELQKGATLLDARKTAVEAAINTKVKSLLAQDDAALAGVESTIKGLKKSASRLTTPLSLEYVVPTEEDDLKSIFDSMH